MLVFHLKTELNIANYKKSANILKKTKLKNIVKQMNKWVATVI